MQVKCCIQRERSFCPHLSQWNHSAHVLSFCFRKSRSTGYEKRRAPQNNLFKYFRCCGHCLPMFLFDSNILYRFCLVNERAVFMIRRCDDGGCRRQDIICQTQAWWRLYNHVVKLLYCCQYGYVTGIQQHSREQHENVCCDHAVSSRCSSPPSVFSVLFISTFKNIFELKLFSNKRLLARSIFGRAWDVVSLCTCSFEHTRRVTVTYKLMLIVEMFTVSRFPSLLLSIDRGKKRLITRMKY